ncbi:MAG: hypothetical protein IKF72_07145 [Kiritimatiellae bacterium]|nr:hypothetical protein [Kiritimatiellia bacterium]
MEKDMIWGMLLHLGSNMWGEWENGLPKSTEEERKRWPDDKLDSHGLMPSRVIDCLRVDEALWREETELVGAEGYNMLIVDVGEAYAFPSHPELWVKGSWDAEKISADLARLRKLGLEPIPKLNFSTGHDAWLKDYHHVTSTPEYYKVIADVIRDVAEVFDHPRYFHIGYDEEVPVVMKERKHAIMRHGDLWWNDLYYTVNQVERCGARAMMWSDRICCGREEYLKRMSRGVLQVPWYYGDEFPERRRSWRPELEKKLDTWEHQHNLAASILELDRVGFDILPCTSNWSHVGGADAMLGFCKENVNPAHLKGYMMAPWARTVAEEKPKVIEGIKVFAAARRKHYPEETLVTGWLIDGPCRL